MDFRNYLKIARNAIQGKVLTLDYKWKPDSRELESQVLNQKLHAGLLQNLDYFNRFIPPMLSYLPVFKSIPATRGVGLEDVYWQNDYLPGLDLVFLYTLVREYKPLNIVEIGSGHSTAVMRKAIGDGHLNTKVSCIDPQPRRKLKSLADEVIPFALEDLKTLELFSRLEPGDILFFDGSHISFPNSDVTVFFMEILPMLAPGVIVQIHDIYLPFDYPIEMALRGYNEQYLLAQLLRFGWPDKIEILFPAFWVSGQDSFLKKMTVGLWDHLPNEIEKHGGSFWFTLKH